MSYEYKKLRISKNQTRDEHRYVMELHIGRKLEFNEIVHHKDGNKKNNDLSNLEIISRKIHSSMHMKEFMQDKLFVSNIRQKQLIGIRNYHKNRPKYTCLCLTKEQIKLAKEAWPCAGVSLRKFAAHYGIHHKQMSRVLNELNI